MTGDPRYEALPELSPAGVEAAVRRGDPDELLRAVLSAALYAADPEWAAGVCLRLAAHPHPGVRGNAVLGLGHLARLHGRLDRARVQPVLEAALSDPDPFVRGQADAAVDDVEHFLGWRTARPNPLRDWMEGGLPGGVAFALNQPVRLAGGPRAGEAGSVVLLLRLDPDPLFCVELGTGEDVHVRQSGLRPLP